MPRRKPLNEKLQATQGELRSTLYAAHTNLAKNAWDAGHTGRVLGLLEQHRPKPGEADLRSFEWHYLNRLCHSDLLTIMGSGAAYSPDGKRLASGSGGLDERGPVAGDVKVWDAQTGQELLSLKLNGPLGESRRIAFSPDGNRLARWDEKSVAPEPSVKGVKTFP